MKPLTVYVLLRVRILSRKAPNVTLLFWMTLRKTLDVTVLFWKIMRKVKVDIQLKMKQ
ncbi:hypothetical protein PC116_g25063 [Phytophthora cactorum]|nr:hypothetical protein PC116_g25063 [Phytophthora cactorum]